MFICVKNYIDCRELMTDNNFEMIPFEVKGRDPKFTWEIVRIYRDPNEDMRVIERLAARTDYKRNSTKRSIIGMTKTYSTQMGMETRLVILELRQI